VKTLGEFEGVEDFRAKLKENLAFEKNRRAQDKHRLDIIDGILEKTTLELPDIMVDAEVDQILYSMKSDVSRMGMTFEKYLESVGKTEEDIRKDLRPDGEKRAKLQVVVASISKEEKLKPEQEIIEKEIEMIKKQYPEANEENARAYVETILTNDLVFKFLDKQ